MQNRAHQIFEEACNVSTEQRESFLRETCGGDESLQAEVASLLEAHDQAGDFLSAPTADFVTPVPITTSLPEEPGKIIDRYKLLECIGEGGFGVVYMAQQSEPVRRRVALKIIKLGMDTKQVVARFEAERQALAMMDHPNIAGVLDGGETDSGRPYFVMELVKGEPITSYCDRARLSTRDRLELFQQVCHAIQHAHQKGIIHRDIKPSNVLVTMANDRPLVKVIDFGIAKATSSELTEKTLFTEFRQVIGTPQYMSPEQAESTGVDVDTRTDVYSLGVLLYEMLTGRTPIDPKKLSSAAWHELQRVICDEEPTKPSTLVASGIGDAEDVASRRSTQPSRLGGLLRGDLDWIVLKSLEKDRARRYDSASGLADDIDRYLKDEAVEATPPSAGYRFSKFARRNRPLIAGSAAVLAALLLGIVGTTAMAIMATSARDRAEAAEAEISLALEQARDQAIKARRASIIVGASVSLPDDETEALAEQWKEDLRKRQSTAEEGDKSVAEEQTQFASWYGTWLMQHKSPESAVEFIEPYMESSRKTLGPSNGSFFALANAYTAALATAAAPPQKIATAYEELLPSMALVRGKASELQLYPEFAVALGLAGQDDRATEIITTYLERRGEDSSPPSAIENMRLDFALTKLSLWGENHKEIYARLKDFRETGSTAATGDQATDPQLAKDLAMLQGRWESKRWDKGELTEHMIVEMTGNTSKTKFFDSEGKIKHVVPSVFQLSRSGGVKIYTTHRKGSPNNKGSFIYRIDPNRFVIVQGMLVNERSLPGTDRRVYWRMEEGESTKD